MYRVFINGRLEAEVATVREAWEVVGNQPFGSLYSVGHTDPDVDCSEFVPF